MIDITGKKIIVVGDVMLGRYWHGDTNRISPEVPVPVVHIEDSEVRPTSP
jgi:D-beta-D-heptose 7-phosphate kinase/D-beta-D-heptose 1-phosphate adenosyltransferase